MHYSLKKNKKNSKKLLIFNKLRSVSKIGGDTGSSQKI